MFAPGRLAWGVVLAGAVAIAGPVAAAPCAAPAPCDYLAQLGALEREAVELGLARHRAEIDPLPWGKRVRAVRIHNVDVFVDGDGWLRWFNRLHVTSTETSVRREVVLAAGKPWDPAAADETARRLRDPVFSVLAAVVPIVVDASTVDALVVTRDVWSLRLNTDYRYQDGELTFLTFAASENNLLGRRKLVALAVEMDQGTAGLGPVYLDPNIAGTRLRFFVRHFQLANRQALLDDGRVDGEGGVGVVLLERPLYSLTVPWGGGTEVRYRDGVTRSFAQRGVRTYDAPETPEDDAIPWAYAERTVTAKTGVVRAFGEGVEHRIRFGHELVVQRPEVPAELSPPLAAAFARDVLPRSERTSALVASYEAFTPTYRAFRDVGQFDLQEDVRLGPTVTGALGFGHAWLGSEATFGVARAGGGWTWPWGADGLASVTADASLQVRAGALIDSAANASAKLVSPTLGCAARIVAEVRVATLLRETQNRFLSLGGDNGLRGFGVGEFTGQRSAVLQVEARTRPVRLGFTRWGAVAFWDVGGTGARAADVALHQNVGLGARVLIPQASSQLLRVDAAFPVGALDLGGYRITAGFESEF